MRRLFRAIAQYILIAQFRRNLARGTGEIFGIADNKIASTRELTDLVQQAGAQPLFFRRKVAVVNADGINK